MPHTSLTHVTKKIPSGGQVIILNTGAAINPEAEAMLQALHSRSVGGIAEHLQKLATKGSDAFMASFYVGYGHKSIGDCGSITVFIEGVSMLAAKAVQDWPLYSGQESSTRYVDFSKQPFINPIGTPEGATILETWRSFYLAAMEPLRNALRLRFPIADGEKQTIYEKAIAARAFDILRGFLPAGASTNLAWHSNLRQMADKVALLRHHPLPEAQDIANALDEALREAHPSSFSHKRYDDTEAYHASVVRDFTYFTGEYTDGVSLLRDSIDRTLLARYRAALTNRAPKTELPKVMAECGTLQFGFMLDFGSFRDLQRHRAITQQMPLVTTTHGFHPWYLEELPDVVRRDAITLLLRQEHAIAALHAAPELAQYYTAMGYQLPNRITGTLPALVYLAELRATRFVHPTLAHVAAAIAHILERLFSSDGLVLHLDSEPGRFDVRRGTHDIVTKEAPATVTT